MDVYFHLSAILILCLMGHVESDRNRFVTMPNLSYCGRTLSEDGIVITASHQSMSTTCRVTISTGSFLSNKKLLVRFTNLRLPSLGAVRPTIALTLDGAIMNFNQNTTGFLGKTMSSSSAVILEFSNMLSNSDFTIVITRTEDDLMCAGEHLCTITRYCIDKDLRCDGIDHCGDNSDETSHLCTRDVEIQLTPIGVIIGGAVVALVVVIAIGVTIAICRRRGMINRFASRRAPTLADQVPPHAPATYVAFARVPQSDPAVAAGATQPNALYPTTGGYWPPPTVQPPQYDDAVKSGQHPGAPGTYPYPSGSPAPYPHGVVPGVTGAAQPPYLPAPYPTMAPPAPYPSAGSAQAPGPQSVTQYPSYSDSKVQM